MSMAMAIRRARQLAIAILLAILGSSLLAQSPRGGRPPGPGEFPFKIVRTFPHDSSAFTQGLAYRDGFLYEGTGLRGRSSLRKIHLETGAVVQRVDLAPEFFGEGVT